MIQFTYNLFLDDVRLPSDCTLYKTSLMPWNRSMYTLEQWEIVRNYEEFVSIVAKKFEKGEFPRKVSFDHDLAELQYHPGTWTESFYYHEKTGNDAAKWFVEFCIENELLLPECYVHSQNPVGAKRIYETLCDFDRFYERFSRNKD